MKIHPPCSYAQKLPHSQFMLVTGARAVQLSLSLLPSTRSGGSPLFSEYGASSPRFP
jgi:hypothetical protein